MIDRMLLPWSAYETIKPGNRAFKVSSSRLMNDQPPSNFFPLGRYTFSSFPPRRNTSPLSEFALETRAEGRRLEDTFNEVSRTTASYSAPPPPVSRHPYPAIVTFFSLASHPHADGRFRCARVR